MRREALLHKVLNSPPEQARSRRGRRIGLVLGADAVVTAAACVAVAVVGPDAVQRLREATGTGGRAEQYTSAELASWSAEAKPARPGGPEAAWCEKALQDAPGHGSPEQVTLVDLRGRVVSEAVSRAGNVFLCMAGAGRQGFWGTIDPVPADLAADAVVIDEGSCPDRAPSRLAPRQHCRRYRGVQAGHTDRLDQQHRPGLRDRPAATTLDVDARVQPDTPTHLESASDGRGNEGLDNPHSRWAGALSALLTSRRTTCSGDSAKLATRIPSHDGDEANDPDRTPGPVLHRAGDLITASIDGHATATGECSGKDRTPASPERCPSPRTQPDPRQVPMPLVRSTSPSCDQVADRPVRESPRLTGSPSLMPQPSPHASVPRPPGEPRPPDPPAPGTSWRSPNDLAWVPVAQG